VRISDCPATGHGRHYLVAGRDDELHRNDELTALIADYVDQAARLGRCPLERDSANEED
jgi:hypothetical protein